MRRKVLLADDSLSIQKMFGLYLDKCGIEVVTTGNGELAVSKLPTVRPDLILADVFMPGRTGYEVCEYVKQHPDFKHIPVLLLTGKFEPYDEKEAKRVRADGHIVKPIAEQEFISIIRTTLERFPPKPSVTQPTPTAQSPSVTQPVSPFSPPAERTQVLGSTPPPITPAKEPAEPALPLPQFHLGSLESSSDVPPTIKVTPAIMASLTSRPPIDEGRLPDLEPLTPLETPSPSAATNDATDFILDLPPPEQVPPVLTYPEPPKTLSMPIPRPTFSSLPAPSIGMTTAKLNPADLPELLTAATPQPSLEADSLLEIDDAATPIPSPVSPLATTALPTTATNLLATDEGATPLELLPETPASERAPAAAVTEPAFAESAALPVPAAPMVTEPPSSAAPLPTELPSPSFEVGVSSQPQVAEEQLAPEPAASTTLSVTPALETPTETPQPSATVSPATQAPDNLLAEPIPPPDFLREHLPAAHEPAASFTPSLDVTPAAEPLPAPEQPLEPSVTSPEIVPELVSFSPLPTLAPPTPTFEVTSEEEPSVHKMDLLPDELVASQQRSPVPIESVSEGVAPTVGDLTQSSFTAEATEYRTGETAPAPVEADMSPAVPTVSAEALPASSPVLTPTSSFSLVADDVPLAEPSAIPAFVPTPLEAIPLEEAVASPTAETTPSLPTTTDESTATAEAAPEAPIAEAPTELPAVAMAQPPAVALTETHEVSSAEALSVVPTEVAVETTPEPTMPQEMPAVESPSVLASAPTLDWSTFTLPPAVMDEIVRRVVAEISDHVVREIAWEVVPDLAELLIKKHLASGNGRHNADG